MDSYLYKEEIIDHYKNPQNFGKPGNFDISAKQLNPFCGDEIEVFITFHKNIIQSIYFSGFGCALSIAGASLLTEHVKGMNKNDLTKFSKEDMLKLLGIDISETRKKCALLGWAVLQDCLGQNAKSKALNSK